MKNKNWYGKNGDCVVLKKPKFIPHNGDTICVDIGMEKIIRELWKIKITTLGCCSGHGKEAASIIVENIKNEKDLDKIKKCLDKFFPYSVSILQWQLVSILAKVNWKD